MKNKEQKKKSIKFKIFAALAAVAVAAVLILISPVFSIKSIEVVSECSDEIKNEILSFTSEAKGKNGIIYVSENINGFGNIDSFFNLRAKNVEDAIIFSMPELKNVSVKFVFPNTLCISFGKREPAYLIEVAGNYICADSDGFVLKVYQSAHDAELPVVRGIELSQYKIGNYIDSSSKNQIKVLKAIFNEIYKCDKNDESFKLLSHIEIVDVSEYNEIWLFIGDNLSVKLGDTDNIEYKIPALKEILQTEDMLEREGQIDFTVSENPIFKAGK